MAAGETTRFTGERKRERQTEDGWTANKKRSSDPEGAVFYTNSSVAERRGVFESEGPRATPATARQRGVSRRGAAYGDCSR